MQRIESGDSSSKQINEHPLSKIVIVRHDEAGHYEEYVDRELRTDLNMEWAQHRIQAEVPHDDDERQKASKAVEGRKSVHYVCPRTRIETKPNHACGKFWGNRGSTRAQIVLVLM
jgi:hypothetical protein